MLHLNIFKFTFDKTLWALDSFCKLYWNFTEVTVLRSSFTVSGLFFSQEQSLVGSLARLSKAEAGVKKNTPEKATDEFPTWFFAARGKECSNESWHADVGTDVCGANTTGHLQEQAPGSGAWAGVIWYNLWAKCDNGSSNPCPGIIRMVCFILYLKFYR